MSSMCQIKEAPSGATTLEVAFPKKHSHNGFSQQPSQSADIFSQTNPNDEKTWLHYTALDLDLEEQKRAAQSLNYRPQKDHYRDSGSHGNESELFPYELV